MCVWGVGVGVDVFVDVCLCLCLCVCLLYIRQSENKFPYFSLKISRNVVLVICCVYTDIRFLFRDARP